MEDLYKWIDSIIASANGTSFIAGVIAGLLWNRFAPAIRAFVARTPTKADDMAIALADFCLGADSQKTCVEELNKLLTNEQIVKLVQLRKAKIAEIKAKENQQTPPVAQ